MKSTPDCGGPVVGGSRNRKRPKSFLQKARKFGKSGRFGRGREIEKDTYDYFVGVLDRLGRGFGTDGDGGDPGRGRAEDADEEQAVFVENVFRQTEGNEALLCGNQLVSRVIERLLPISSFADRLRFMQELSEDLRQVSIDPFASHVLETLLVLATFDAKLKVVDCKNEEAIKFRKNAGTWVLRVAKFAVNNLEEFSANSYASHVLRTCLQCLAGVRLQQGQNQFGQRGHHQSQKHGSTALECCLLEKVEPDDKASCQEALLNALKKIEDVQDLRGFAMNPTTSGVLQTLLLALGHLGLKRDLKRLWQLLDKKVFEGAALPCVLKDESKDEEEPISILEQEPCCRLIEAALTASTEAAPKVWLRIASSLFDGRLLTWARHPVGNFTLQKLIGSCSDKEKFEQWYSEELDDNIEAILASGHHGVVVSIAQAARRLNAKQAHFLVALMKSLHCYEPQQRQSQFALLLAHLSTLEAFNDVEEQEGPSVSIHGSLILQETLNFQKPIKVTTSLLETDPGKLCGLLCDPKGCHVTDSFMASQMVGEKSRDGLVRALHGKLALMACSKHGSRSIDAMWEKASGKAKEMMATELSARIGDISSDKFGSYIAQKLHLALFKRSKDDWRRAVSEKAKTQTAAKEFLKEIARPKQVPSGKTNPDDASAAMEKGPLNKRNHRQALGLEEVKANPIPPKKKSKSYLDDL